MSDAAPLRLARPDDAAAIASLIRLAFSAQSVATNPPPSARLETAETVGGHFASGGGGVVAGDFLAAVLWTQEGDAFHVRRLSVHPSFRQRGLARLLLRYAEHQARALGAVCIHLSTRLILIDNRRLFAACGFVETTLHAHPGYAAPTYVDLEKRL